MSFNSASYWDNRYKSGRNSGSGSYGKLAKFKAKILNRFVKRHNVKSVLELGCGDGNQLGLSKYPKYIGADVSGESIKLCREKFKNDKTKSFLIIGKDKIPNADMAMSLDVVFHLVEDEVFENHMKQLFDLARCYVVIYASNIEDLGDTAEHVKHRKFTDWIDKNAKNWQLVQKIHNKYPFDPKKPDTTSFSDFYIFKNST